MSFNAPAERTFVYEDSFFQFTQGGTKRLLMIKNWNFTPNISDFDIDRIDSATPIYTKKSDVLGTFTFDTASTIDLYASAGSAGDPNYYKYWAIQIAAGDPAIITIVMILHAPKASGNDDAIITFQGRITSCPLNRAEDTGVHTVAVSGEITNISSITTSG